MKTLLYLIVATFLFSCKSEKLNPEIDMSAIGDSIPAQESWNAKIYFTDQGVLNAILHAEHILVYSDQSKTYLEELNIDFYNSEEVKTTNLTSRRGRVNEITKDMYAIEDVVAVSDSGVTLLTEELMWRNKDNKIVTDKFVTILTEDEKIEGYGFESDQSLSNYTIFEVTYQAYTK
ncbi:MAG: LPS export ABC transporter periplasmic protein LptC [Melioribacteraceae bacterium]|nr:LPS export ABC transporter periplasmic protein LptC [Melioribacteraceae bacterium]MCF8264299.1 LPS export ABC transporter periplasmic protein LptC [Melioribacteraceae bacterium]MCF8432275.1 LPS export ABC transporter periplasmic protein LptC [Melioribacteraceae bacterium]